MSAAKEEFFPVLRNVTIFAGINEDALRKLFEQCRVIEYRPGDYIMRQGTAATEIYVILRGKVKIILDKDCDALEIVELGPGHCVGEASVIGVQNHSASAYCETETLLLELSRKTLMEISDYDKNLFSLLILNLARELARRLHRTDEILLHYSRKYEGPRHTETQK